MGRHLNCYQLVSDVREGVNEFSTGYLQGTDTSGAFTNTKILARINEAVRFLWNLTFVRAPEDYLTSSDLTPVASVITLPADFMKLRRLEYKASGQKIHQYNVDQKASLGVTGSKYLYRPYQRKYLRIDQDNVTDQVTAWYFKRPRDIHFGQAQSGSGSNALKMPSATGVNEDDFYNGMTVEDITAALVSTISDYVGSTRVATVAGTVTANDWYGLVPEIPEEFHHLVTPKAVLLLKNDPKSPIKATPKDVADFNEMLSLACQAYYGSASSDIPVEEIFLDLPTFY